jgi:uncharacterized protein (TIGR03435 family)
MRTALMFTVALVLGTAMAAQTPPVSVPDARALFELADVHAAPANATSRAPVFSAGRFDARAQTLLSLITLAYDVNAAMVVGGPNWLDFERFDIAARVPVGAAPADGKLMLQALLADRFSLVLRKEDRPHVEYALVVGKGGLKVMPSDGSPGPPACRNVRQLADATAVMNEYECHNVSMDVLAQRLEGLSAGYFEGPVTNTTGLTGTWDAHIAVTPSSARAAAGDGISVFEAAERLGLSLERREVPVPSLVVAAAERPSSNAPGVVAALAVPAIAGDFEVASIKPMARSAIGGINTAVLPNGRVTLRNATLKDLIAFAWDVNARAVVGVPPSLAATRFEVLADVPESVPRPIHPDAVRPMVRRLLASRFRLAVHDEMQPIDSYVLRAKREIKMTRGNDAERGWCKSTPERIPPNSGLSSAITCTNTTMVQLVDRMPGIAPNYLNGLPVFDETGLAGTWNFLILWTGLDQINGRVNGGQPGDRADALSQPGTLTVFESLERLGLKLSQEKRPAPVLVIDHVEETPAGN